MNIWQKHCKYYYCHNNICYICNVYHLNQARRLAIFTAGIFYAHSITYSSVPCGVVNAPTA
nr:MAG TPA: hypothetical protein [Caudoviricetes sp.]